MTSQKLSREDAEALIGERAKQQATDAVTGRTATGMIIDENVKPPTTVEEQNRVAKMLADAQDQFRIEQKIVEKITAPFRALTAKLKGEQQKKHVHNPQIAAIYNEIRTMRKIYFGRRRLPKGHPDRIEGPIPEMET